MPLGSGSPRPCRLRVLEAHDQVRNHDVVLRRLREAVEPEAVEALDAHVAFVQEQHLLRLPRSEIGAPRQAVELIVAERFALGGRGDHGLIEANGPLRRQLHALEELARDRRAFAAVAARRSRSSRAAKRPRQSLLLE